MTILDIVQGALRPLRPESANHARKGGIALKLCDVAIFVTTGLVGDARQSTAQINSSLYNRILRYINGLTIVDIAVLVCVSRLVTCHYLNFVWIRRADGRWSQRLLTCVLEELFGLTV